MCLNFLAEIFKLYEIDTRRVLPLGPRCRGAIESSGAGPPGPQARGTGPHLCGGHCATCAGRSAGVAGAAGARMWLCLHVSMFYVCIKPLKTDQENKTTSL